MLDACHSAGAGEVKNLRLVTETKTRDGYQLKAGLDKKIFGALSQGAW
jgi:hypothetical protein